MPSFTNFSNSLLAKYFLFLYKLIKLSNRLFLFFQEKSVFNFCLFNWSFDFFNCILIHIMSRSSFYYSIDQCLSKCLIKLDFSNGFVIFLNYNNTVLWDFSMGKRIFFWTTHVSWRLENSSLMASNLAWWFWTSCKSVNIWLSIWNLLNERRRK